MDRIESRDNQKLKTIRRLRRSKGKQSRGSRGTPRRTPSVAGSSGSRPFVLDMVLVTDKAATESVAPARALQMSGRARCARTPRRDRRHRFATGAGRCRAGSRPLLRRARSSSSPQTGDDIFLFCSAAPRSRQSRRLGAQRSGLPTFGLCCFPQGCVQPFHPRALRASAGALLSLPVAHPVTACTLWPPSGSRRSPWCRRGEATCGTPSLPSPLALMVGSEASGLDAASDRQRRPGSHHPDGSTDSESLNATVAASVVLLCELVRRRQHSGERP